MSKNSVMKFIDFKKDENGEILVSSYGCRYHSIMICLSHYQKMKISKHYEKVTYKIHEHSGSAITIMSYQITLLSEENLIKL